MKRSYGMIAAILSAAILSLSGCQRDDRPLHARIADAMYHDHFDPQWEHLVERYGEEEFTVDPEDTTGGIYSPRFEMWVNLFWDESEKTYRDNYITYLRQEELIQLLDAAFGDILGQDDYKIYALPYLYCPPSFNRDTTAQELLEVSEITNDILVQTEIYTTKDPAGQEDDLLAIQEAIQSRGWSLYVDIEYIPKQHLDLIPENKRGDPYDGGMPTTVLQKEFYYYRATAYIRPDSFEWSMHEGWRIGAAQGSPEIP